MGIFSQVLNRKKTDREKHAMKWKRQKKAIKKAAKGQPPVDIKDANLFSVDQLKNKLKHPRNNIDISNKKRKRILKRLKHHQLREKEKDEDEEDEGDVEMAGTKETIETPTSSAATTSTDSKTSQASTSTSSASTTTSKKKKRGGRKKRKGKGQAADVDMEDVEMK